MVLFVKFCSHRYSLFHPCPQGSHAQVARTLLNCMNDDRLEPDVITVNSAIGVLARSWDQSAKAVDHFCGIDS